MPPACHGPAAAGPVASGQASHHHALGAHPAAEPGLLHRGENHWPSTPRYWHACAAKGCFLPKPPVTNSCCMHTTLGVPTLRPTKATCHQQLSMQQPARLQGKHQRAQGAPSRGCWVSRPWVLPGGPMGDPSPEQVCGFNTQPMGCVPLGSPSTT